MNYTKEVIVQFLSGLINSVLILSYVGLSPNKLQCPCSCCVFDCFGQQWRFNTSRLFGKLNPLLTHFIGALLVVSLPEPDGPWIGGNEDGAAQERSQRCVEDGGEKSLK